MRCPKQQRKIHERGHAFEAEIAFMNVCVWSYFQSQIW